MELDGSVAPPTALIRSLEALMDQPELGSAFVAADAVAITLSYRWESGWLLSYSARRSGSEVWQKCAEDGLDAAEAHSRVQDLLACTLGLA